MFVCFLWICLFFVLIMMGHPQKVPLKIYWRFDLIWQIYSGSKKYLFVSLCVCFFDFFVLYFNHLGTPTRCYPENVLKIQLDLAEILRILKCLFVCLFVYLFVFILIIMGHPQEYTLKISWKSDLIWLRYLGSKKLFICLFVCLFVYRFVFYFNHSVTSTESSPENFVKVRLDLAEILRIRKLDWNLIICLFVCLFAYRFVCFLL